nr:glycoprotein [Bronnoya virus]
MKKVVLAMLLAVMFAGLQSPPVMVIRPGTVPGAEAGVPRWGCEERICRVQCNHVSGAVVRWNLSEVGIGAPMRSAEKICRTLERERENHDGQKNAEAKKLLCQIEVERENGNGLILKFHRSKEAEKVILSTLDHRKAKEECPDLGKTPETLAVEIRTEMMCENIGSHMLCPVRYGNMLKSVSFVSQPKFANNRIELEQDGITEIIQEKTASDFKARVTNRRYTKNDLTESLLNFWTDYSEGSFKSLNEFIGINSEPNMIEEDTGSREEHEDNFLTDKERKENKVKGRQVVEGRSSEITEPQKPKVVLKGPMADHLGAENLYKVNKSKRINMTMKQWDENTENQPGFTVWSEDDCKLTNLTNAIGMSEVDRVSIVAMSQCHLRGEENSCRCLGTNAPRFVDGSNSICFADNIAVVEEVKRVYHERMDMCAIYCTIRNGKVHGGKKPVYRTMLYRTPFQSVRGNTKSSLEDRQAHIVSQSKNVEKFAECWPEDYGSYLHEPAKRVMRKAFEDKDSWCGEEEELGTKDFIEIPSSCIEENSTVYSTKHLKVQEERTSTWLLCTKKIGLCYDPHCAISMKSTSLKAEITMKAMYAKYTLRDGMGNSYNGYFEGEKVVEINFEEPGQRSVHGMCNRSPLERKVILSVKEYCDEKHPGPSGVPMNIYCKRPKLIKITGTILLISLVLHMGKGYIGTMGAIVGTLMTFWVTWCLMANFQCENCNCFRLRKKKHTCKNFRCKRCLAVYCTHKKCDSDQISITRELQAHTKRCERKRADDSTFSCAVSATFDCTAMVVETFCKLFPTTGGIIACVIILNLMWSGADGKIIEEHERMMKKALSDMSEYIERLESEGFHPYNARFTPGQREKLESIKLEKDCATKVCSLTMQIRASVHVTKGREFGFTVYPSSGSDIPENFTSMDVNVKFMEPIRECNYKKLYSTGKAIHKSVSKDTCTEGCGPCLGELRGLEEVKKLNMIKPIEHTHENSASWGCDGPGCLAINQGCTCGLCWCELEDDNWEVLELVNEKPHVTLCFQFGSEGICKRIGPEERGKDLTVVKGGESPSKCPKMVACERKTQDCRTGDISGIGDFSDVFGSVKKIGKAVTFKAEVRAQEQCLFAKHRWFEYKQCCKDTFHLHETLKQVPFSLKEASGLKKIMPIEDAGEWTLELTLPPYRYMRRSDELKLESLSIDSCHGCHSCEEGGSCLMHYLSNFQVTPEFNCDGVSLDISHISITRGLSKVPFNIYSNKKEGVLNCTVGGFKVGGKYMLIDPPKFPHGDGVLRMDNKKVLSRECKTIMCGWNPFSVGFESVKSIIMTALMVIVFAVVLFIVVKAMAMGTRGLKSIIKDKAEARHRKKW